MKKTASMIALLSVGLMVQACKPDNGPSPVSTAEETIVKIASTGWECLKAPNNLDVPGSVFRVDEDGIMNQVALVDLETRSGTVANARFTEKRKASAGVIANVIGINYQPVSANAGLKATSGSYYDFEVELGERKEMRATDDAILTALKQVSPSVIFADSKYYIIRDAATAQRQKLIVNTDVASEFGGGASFEAQVSKGSFNAGVSKKDEGTYVIDQDFGKDLTVCFRAQKFDPNKQTMGLAGATLDPKLEKEFLSVEVVPES